MATATIERPSGYAATADFFATESRQGDLRMISLSLTWQQVADLVVPPDPTRKSDYNRPLTVPHAKRFGQYVDLTEDPFTPPLTLFTDPANIELASLGDPVLDEFGLRLAKVRHGASLYILDGQHRIYGVGLLFADYRTKLDRAKQTLFRARKNGPEELVGRQEVAVKEWRRKLERLEEMQVTVQVLLTAEGDQARRIFTDVADNAKGISRSLLADFSDRSVFNRVARNLASTLLQGVVDPVHDRMSSKNPHWIALKDVVNVVQALEFPIGKRWSAQRESDLQHREMAIQNMAQSFFEGLIELFPEIGSVIDGSRSGADLRPGGTETSLLGSATMIRALAAAYRRLRIGEAADKGSSWVHKPMSHPEIVAAWHEALPPMTAGHIPDASGERDQAQPLLDEAWLETGAFSYPYYAPGAAQGQLNALVEKITESTRDRNLAPENGSPGPFAAPSAVSGATKTPTG